MAAKPESVYVTLRKLERAYVRKAEALEASEECIEVLRERQKVLLQEIAALKKTKRQLTAQLKEQK